MGFAIVSTDAFPSNCPVYSEQVANANLRFGVRAANTDTLIDVSDNDYVIANTGATFATAGLVGGNAAYVEAVAPTFNDNAFCSYFVAKVDLNGHASYDCWLGGNFVDSNTGGYGIRILSETDPNNVGKLRIVARGNLAYKNQGASTYGTEFGVLELLNNLDTLPSTTGWLVLALRFNLASRAYTLRNVISGSQFADLTNDAKWVSREKAAAVRNGNLAGVGQWRLLRNKGASTSANTVTIGEHLYWNKTLSDAELSEQLGYSRAFMLNARGVTLP